MLVGTTKTYLLVEKKQPDMINIFVYKMVALLQGYQVYEAGTASVRSCRRTPERERGFGGAPQRRTGGCSWERVSDVIEIFNHKIFV